MAKKGQYFHLVPHVTLPAYLKDVLVGLSESVPSLHAMYVGNL